MQPLDGAERKSKGLIDALQPTDIRYGTNDETQTQNIISSADQP